MSGQSLDELLRCWRSGNQAAATEIYRRFHERVRRLFTGRIGRLLRPKVQEESVVLFVMDSLLREIERGKLPLESSGQILGLAKTAGEHFLCNKSAYWTALKRDSRNERRLPRGDSRPEPAVLDPFAAHLAVADECERIRAILPPNLFEVFALDFDGCTSAEIAEKIGRARQTVDRWKKEIARLLEASYGAGPPDGKR
ncbi:MAG: ECF-type sigma factor [Pirellulales bacterium]